MSILMNSMLRKTVRQYIVLTVFFIIFLLTSILVSQESAQDTQETKEINGAALLQQFVGSRAASMGEASAAVSDDIYALHYNPAGLVKGKQEFGISYFKDPTTLLKYTFIGYGQTFKGFGALANSLYFYDAGKVVFEDEDGYIQSMDFQRDYLYTVGFARKAFKNLALGINLKLYSSTMRELYFAESYAMDLGAIYATPLKGVSLGAVLQNLGPPIKYIEEKYPLPKIIRAGIAYKLSIPTKNKSASNKFTISADIVKSSDNVIRENFGAECSLKDVVFLRAGYKKGYNLQDYSFGVGLRWYGFQVDYGAILHELEAVNPISIGWRKTKKPAKQEKEEDKVEDKAEEPPKQNTEQPVINVEKPVAKTEQPIITVEQPPTLERDPRVIKKLSDEFIDLCRKGEYSEALKKVMKQREIDPNNVAWARMAEKLEKIVNIMPSAVDEGKVQELIRKTVNGYLAIKGNERIAVMAVKYAIQLDPKNQSIVKLCDLITQEYPGIAKAEITKPYISVVEQKVSSALDYIYEGKYDKAIMECDDALSLEENNVIALKRKGSAYFALGKKEIALNIWKKAEFFAPNDLEI